MKLQVLFLLIVISGLVLCSPSEERSVKNSYQGAPWFYTQVVIPSIGFIPTYQLSHNHEIPLDSQILTLKTAIDSLQSSVKDCNNHLPENNNELENKTMKLELRSTQFENRIQDLQNSVDTLNEQLKHIKPTCANEVNIVKPDLPVASSSIFDHNHLTVHGIDNNLDSYFGSDYQSNAWWSIDLQHNYKISKIQVLNREILLERFGKVTIYLSTVPESDSTKFGQLTIFGENKKNQVPASPWIIHAENRDMYGRYMYIQMAKDREILEFSDLKIYTCLD